MELVLIRHPPVDVPAGTCYGQQDVPLLPGWESELDALKADIFHPQDLVFSSPSQRCVLPAERWGTQPVHCSTNLMELNFGNWEGKRWNDIPEAELMPWMKNYRVYRPPGGETLTELWTRVSAWLETCSTLSADRVIVFTHAGVIRILVTLIEKRPEETLFDIEVPYLRPIRLNITP
jgi:alpha-ribazole phosphatase